MQEVFTNADLVAASEAELKSMFQAMDTDEDGHCTQQMAHMWSRSDFAEI